MRSFPRGRWVRRPGAKPDGPHDLVAHNRSVMFWMAQIALALTTLGGLARATPVGAGLVVASSVTLAASWTFRRRVDRAHLFLDVVDILAALVFTMACWAPATAFGIAFSGLWFRAVYGRRWEIVTYAVGMSAAMAAAVPLWGVVPGHIGSTEPAAVFGTLPILLLNCVGARQLAVGLFARNRAQQRDRALTALGTQLLGLTQPEEIHQHGWEAAAAICGATPGLRVLGVADDGDRWRVLGSAGKFVHVPSVLPRNGAATGPGEDARILDSADLAAAAGFDGEWIRIPLPEEPLGAMLVGAPSRVPEDGLVAIQSMVNQVALAMRNSESHRDLAAQALTDSLTGLANRAAFTAALGAAVAGGGDVWALFVDLDDFKIVNDGMGHAAGDALLQHVADRFGTAVRGEDLCARLGGDEFAVLLRDADEDTAWAVGQRLMALSSAPVTLDGRVAQVGASVGIAALRPGMTAAELVQHADVAMYAAKAAGKNRVRTFQPSLLEVDEVTALEGELRVAVETGQLAVLYQPIVSAVDGRCTAVEALVRWDHPVRGLLAPVHFLDVAERSGLIVPMGEQVLRQACADVANWQALGRPVAVHVNAAPSQLGHPDFLAVVRDCLAEQRLAPEQLVIEITESTALESPVAQAAVRSLADLGVGIAIDDFGTGYAALTALRSLPIDIVKIDRSFVSGAATDVADQAVLLAVIEMAQRMGLQTVAEGVEDADQQQFVQSAGVSAVQGYLHLRPTSAAELTAWLADPARGIWRPAQAAGVSSSPAS